MDHERKNSIPESLSDEAISKIKRPKYNTMDLQKLREEIFKELNGDESYEQTNIPSNPCPD